MRSGGAGFLNGLASATQARMVPMPSGVLVISAEDTVIGAVGATGDSLDNDEICAIAGMEAAKLTARPGA